MVGCICAALLVFPDFFELDWNAPAEIPAPARGLVLVRVIAYNSDWPAPEPPGPRHFLMSAILLDAGG